MPFKALVVSQLATIAAAIQTQAKFSALQYYQGQHQRPLTNDEETDYIKIASSIITDSTDEILKNMEIYSEEQMHNDQE